MTFIIAVTGLIYFILIVWTWHSLGFVEKQKKVGFIVIGLLIISIITLIMFQLAKGGIYYENAEMQKNVQMMLVSIFSAVNGMIVMPQMGKMLDKVNEDEMKKEEFRKKIIILLIVFILCLAFEVWYMKDTQEGILRTYHMRRR